MNSKELCIVVPPSKTQQEPGMARREESSFKHSETSQGQRSGGESGRSHGSTQEASNEEVHLIMEVLRSPIMRKLVRQVREQLKRQEGAPSSPSEHDPEVGNTIPDNNTAVMTPNGSRIGSWVKRRLLSLQTRIRKRTGKDKYKDKSYDPELHVQGYSSATNTVVVVAALIATLSFAALLQPPGGIGGGDDVGTANLASKPAFKVFFIANGMALFVALLTILILTSVVPQSHHEARVLYEQGKVLVWVATVFTVIAFSSAAYIVAGDRNRNLAWIMFGGAGATIFVLFAVVVLVSVERKLKKIRSRKRRKLQRSQNIQDPRMAETPYNRFLPVNNAISSANSPADQ